VLADAAGRILLARRPADKHGGGFWEFPGGKIAAGETPLAGLKRELLEELGITVLAAEALLSFTHDYPDRSVRLHVWLVSRYAGQPQGLEGQPLKWVAVADLGKAAILPADRPIIAALAALPAADLLTAAQG